MFKKHEVDTLYRTYSPTFNAYDNDGLGRDTYIGYNHGGFWKASLPPGTPMELGYSSKSTKYRFKSYNKDPVIFKYHPDGSGRDLHVLKYSTNGGLSRQPKPLINYQLTDFLRNYEDDINYSLVQKRGFSKEKIYLSKNEIKINKILLKNQKGIIDRLYTKEKHKFMPKMYFIFLFYILDH